jgi:hypothetical protein
MSPPFAMHLVRAFKTPGRRARAAFEGVVLGRAPAPGDALAYLAPLSEPLRVHSAVALGSPRGGERAPFGLALEEELGDDLDAWLGGVLVEEGVTARFGAAVLGIEHRPGVHVARFEFAADHAWGIVAIAAGASVNVVVVGGGVPGLTIWDGLVSIRLDDRTRIERADVDPLTGSPAAVWRLPVLKTYERGEQRGVLVRRTGLVSRSSCAIAVGDTWRSAEVLQMSRGITQFFVMDEPGARIVDVTVPFLAAA